MAIEAIHEKLKLKEDQNPALKKLLHDYPILLRRIQSAQETIAILKLDPDLTADELKELVDLEKHIDAEVVKRTRSDKIK